MGALLPQKDAPTEAGEIRQWLPPPHTHTHFSKRSYAYEVRSQKVTMRKRSSKVM